MLAQRLRSFVVLPVLALALSAAARASIATPPSGTPIDLTVGASFTIKLKNAQGCHFDYLASAADPGLLDISPDMGTDATKASIKITALEIGATMLTIQSMNGTCPPATHTYPVTITADVGAALKDYSAACKLELKDFKKAFKLEFNAYKSSNSDLLGQFKDGTLSEDTLQDAFHDGAVTLRHSVYMSGWMAYGNVVGLGTQLLADNGITDQAPVDFFAGGGGAFDTFQNGVCGQMASFHGQYQKAADTAINKFVKAGAPRYGQWDVLVPLFSGGPLYPDEVDDFVPPQSLAGPLTITTRPTTNVARDNGRVLVSGLADSSVGAPYHVSLTHAESGLPPVVFDFTPALADGTWTQDFPNLVSGTWMLSTFYEDDDAKVQLPLQVTWTF